MHVENGIVNTFFKSHAISYNDGLSLAKFCAFSMTISYSWLLKYLPESISVEELSQILTSIGLEVEGTEHIEEIKGGLAGLLIGHVLTCEKHPDADKLNITTVDLGGPEPVQIVCGAANVAAGQKVVVAPVGATVHPLNGESFPIKKAKIRGVESQGMICAEDEIGLGDSHAGIMVLPEDAPVGTFAAAYFNVAAPETAIYIGLTPNRSDAMSHIGVARDVCAYLSHHRGGVYQPVFPDFTLPAATGTAAVQVEIAADAQDACLRYTGVSISGVKVGPSPDWLKRALRTIGVRSINNIVDATNYVLHEYGQPLHAFDQDKIAGNKIIARFLPEGTPFVTLDEKERKLYAEDLMICDAEKGLCIAGVFGGNNSGVSNDTINIFLESAYFAAPFIRRSSLRHGLRTDAATHFEKSVDMSNVLPALQRAAALIMEVAGGELAGPVTDLYPKVLEAVKVTATYAYIQQLSGKAYTPDTIKGILKALQFEVIADDGVSFTVIVPFNKADVSQPADLVEEVLRIDGLDNVAIPQRLHISLSRPMYTDRPVREKMAAHLCGLGFQEMVTNSITNSKFYPGNEQLVRMINSLSSELDVLRPSMLESGLEVISYNVNRKSQDLQLFEMGNTYSTEGVGKYQEAPRLAIWVTGNIRTAHWSHKAEAADIFYLKGVLAHMMEVSGIDKVVLQYEDDNSILWKWKNEALCRTYKVSAERLKLFDIKQDVYYAELYWPQWLKATEAHKIKYAEVPKFPAVKRDLALVLDKQTSFEEVQKLTGQLKIASLVDFDLFDVFESEKLGTGKKSYALNYTFQLKDRTLTDAEIEESMQALIKQYKGKLNAEIRS
jgi:phenylalanyl-tRNA synthetase beta chain